MKINWDKVGERRYETGTDHGVLYVANNLGAYPLGVPWNGLTAVTESPTGAETTPTYADNIKYLNLQSAESFEATIEALTYPVEFEVCDGTASPTPGVALGQQTRRMFGFSWRTRVGNDVLGDDFGYKLHLVWGAKAAPSEKAYTTVNETPEPITFSWAVTTTPAEVGTIGGQEYKPTASMTIDSTQVDADALAALETILYGDNAVNPRLPSPAEVVALFEGTVLSATATEPTYNSATKVITIPTVTGVMYQINGETVTGTVTITEDTVVKAIPAPGYVLSSSDDDWLYEF